MELDRLGAKLISLLLGLGLAAVFRQSCRGNGCVVVTSPPKDVVAKQVYELDGECYKYQPYTVQCKEGGDT